MFKIIVDSSSNLTKNYLKNKNIGFSVVPLTIRVGDKEYVDNENVDIDGMLKGLSDISVKSGSSCPSPYAFEKELDGYDAYFIITISQKLSGSYNSALVGSQDKENCFVIDSKLVAGSMEILVNKIVELIDKGLSAKEIYEETIKFRDGMNLFFVLDKFDNLIRNGRMSKIVAFIANMAHIKPLCFGSEGEIKVKAKIRTFKGALHVLATETQKILGDKFSSPIVISHTNNLDSANFLKEIFEKSMNYNNVIIRENRALCAFYSLNGGILVCF